MTAEQLWERYARIWSADTDTRASEMRECLSERPRYCDPNVSVEGIHAFSQYMAGFQASMPDCTFRIDAVSQHHDRMLARWSMLDGNGHALQQGTSFARVSDDGKLAEICGFFPT